MQRRSSARRRRWSAVAIDGAAKLVLVDGVFVVGAFGLRRLAGVGVRTPARSAGEDWRAPISWKAGVTDAMVSLNAALATDGVVIDVADGAALARPLQIIHVATASSASAFTRSQVRIGKGARVTLVESFVAADGAKAYQAHDAVLLSVGDGRGVDACAADGRRQRMRSISRPRSSPSAPRSNSTCST